MTEASSGYRASHSLATSLVGPHFSPTMAVSSEPKNMKILLPTLATTSPSHGSSCHAPGLARQYASISALVMAPPRTGRTGRAPRKLVIAAVRTPEQAARHIAATVGQRAGRCYLSINR